MSLRTPFEARGTTRAISLVAIAVIALIAWSHLRWDASTSQSLIQLDSLHQSRHASRNAELIAERALAEGKEVDHGLVIAELARARVFVNALLSGDGKLAGMHLRRPPVNQLQLALQRYEGTLASAEMLVRDRLRNATGILHSDIRASSVRVDRAALDVEALLLRQLDAQRSQQRVLDAGTILVTALLSLGSLILLAQSLRRNEDAYVQVAESEGRLRAIAGAIPGAIYVLDRDGRYEHAFGYQAGLGTPRADLLIGRRLHDVMPTDLAERQIQLIHDALATRSPRMIEYSRPLEEHEQGAPVHFEGRLNPLGDGKHVVWVSWDVSERWNANQRVFVLKRLYEFLSSVNQAIVWSHDQPTLLDTVCRTATAIGGFKLAWVSWHNVLDGSLRCIACAGQTSVLSSAHDDAPVEDPARRCLALGEVLILDHLSDIQSGWIARAQTQGLTAYAGIPLRDGDTLVGVLNLLDTDIDTDDPEERALLNELGIDISHAITQFSREAQQLETEARMSLLAAALESCQDGVAVTDMNGRIVSVNNAFTRITGYTQEEAIGQKPGFLRSGRHSREFYAAMWGSLSQSGTWQGEIWNRRKNGEIYAQWMSISTVHRADKNADHYVSVFTDISHLKDTEERLKHLAHYDLLTGLPNRTLLGSRLEHALEVSRRQRAYLAVLFIDLDNFKHVNDALGHNVGDELLVAVTKRINSRLRKQDTLGRLGGDEFLLILESLQAPQDAALVASSLLTALDEPMTLASGHTLYVRVSIGISIYPDDGNTAAELIRQADAAMYQAKRAGRSTYRYYTEELTAAANYRLELEARLRRAFDNDEFSLYYQPQVNLATGRLTGAEALVRLQPPGVSPISPATFIPLLEETGLIVQLGEWVLRATCEQGCRWLEAGYDFGTLAINVSSHEIRRGDFVERLRATLDATGFPASRLDIELTESSMMEQGEFSERFIEGVRALGVHLSIDDFGTGYSSLSYLRKLPVDKLKIDRSFIAEIPDNPADAKLTSTIIAMAHNLDITVLAEGVETASQRDFLIQQGCDACQGYLFSPPLPAEAYEARFLQPARPA
ncbi:MAG: EAL domain-containing protein [Candidatus Dactylopiibacterium sp.]|nr:EAL domain-containing protein [Candidatus Dactylopiibacterium sp.]